MKTSSITVVARNTLIIIFSTLLIFIIVETLIRIVYFIRNSSVDYVPLPYVIGHEYGPIPPWLDDLRILVPDDTYSWVNRSNLHRKYIDIFSPADSKKQRIGFLHQFIPRIPSSLKKNAKWEISLNSDGFRGNEFERKKPSSVFRIICLGDSWTFGANVDQADTYPDKLLALLRQRYPAAHFEVLNLGVLGYSSHQGRELLKRKAIDLNPDMVLIGFAMNDASVAGYRDKDVSNSEKTKKSIKQKITQIAEKSESFKLLRYLIKSAAYKPGSVALLIKKEYDTAATGEGWGISNREMIGLRNYRKLEKWTRVPVDDYETNILDMVNLAKKRNSDVILLYNELWPESHYLGILRKISKDERVPLLDSCALISAAQKKIRDDLEQKFDLRSASVQQPHVKGQVEVVFRVYSGSYHVSRGLYIVGAHSKLGELVPNRVRMYDDGTHGDQRAGDKVWTYRETFSPGTKLFYVYTNSGQEGEWEGLDVPYIRAFIAEADHKETTVYRPIESFGEIYMQADGWHTNSDGYELIAKNLLEKLETNHRFKKYLELISAE